MEVRPIFSALLRNKTGAFLISLQIALTLAVVANALFIIVQRLEKMNRPTGMDVDNIIMVASSAFTQDYDTKGSLREDLEALRAIPGVRAATVINQIPLSGGGDSNGYRASTDVPSHEGISANNYMCDEQCVDTLGIELESGRSFTANEITFREPNSSFLSPGVLITRALGEELFGEEDPLGKTIYDGLGRTTTVIGVIRRMQGAWVSWEGLERVMIRPEVGLFPYTRYLIRTEPGQRDAIMPVVEKTLIDLNEERLVRRLTAHADVVEHSYSQDRTMAVILTTVSVLLVTITALGIVGLASFSVSQRTRQIGIRRAIGARRRDILRYFLVENWMITTGGVVLGCILTLAFNFWLVSEYELPRLELVYVLGGIAGLLLLGQLAVLMPARRASAVAPAIATRNV